jgi:hypothetical protein
MFAFVARAVRMHCRCGHSKVAHMHYRPGSDCSGCECPAYRRRF